MLIWFHANLDLPLSLCVKVSPSLWSALLSASQLEKEGFKATPATNREKQSLRLFYLLSCFLSLFWFICDSVSFVFKEKSLILFFVLLKPVFLSFLLTCSFALSFFLSHSFSAFKYHHLFKSLFRFSFGSIAHYLSTLPLIFVCSSLFLFYGRFSCSKVWPVIWFSFNFVWDFLLVSLYLSFFFPLFFFFSCWLSSTYDLIWIFVAFLTAIGVVSLKSDFTIIIIIIKLLI